MVTVMDTTHGDIMPIHFTTLFTVLGIHGIDMGTVMEWVAVIGMDTITDITKAFITAITVDTTEVELQVVAKAVAVFIELAPLAETADLRPIGKKEAHRHVEAEQVELRQERRTIKKK